MEMRSNLRIFRHGLTIIRTFFPDACTPRRAQQPLFCGRLSLDSFQLPQKIQQSVNEAIGDVDEEKFVETAFDLIRHLEKLDNTDPFWLNSDFMFNGKHSNLHSSYSSIFRMTLLKTISAVSPASNSASNYSGHYFVGPRGIGKSVMMQTCCLVVGQLLPNVASIYIDASVLHKSPLRHSLVHLMNDRGQGKFPDLSIDSSIVTILSRVEMLNCAIALFVDEAHVLYKNETDWPDILACITGFRSAVFLSGSDNTLVPCVKLRPEDRAFLNKENNGERMFDHESLNTTKLTQKSVNGLVTPEQYRRFFQSRPKMLSKLCPLLKVNKLSLDSELGLKEIQSLHELTAGRVRAMHALRQGGVEYSELLDFDPKSLTESDIGSLQPFFDVIKQRGHFDPFDLPRLAVDRDVKQDVVFQLLQRKLIAYVRAGVVTLASPAVYLVCQRKPSVFISHAESDKENVLDMVEMLRGIATVVCSRDQQTRSHLSEVESQSEWEKSQILNIGKDGHFGIIVLSSTYCCKVDKGGDVGAAREWNLMTSLPDASRNSVIYAYLGKHANNVNGKKIKDHLRDKPLLRFASSDAKEYFHRLMGPNTIDNAPPVLPDDNVV
jgi:hypothetical protein